MGVRTLVVEDSTPARSVLRRRLEELGCTVVAEADDAVRGLEMFRRLRPDLVTLDLILPRSEQLDAHALFRTIRAESPQAKVIVISAQPKLTTRSDFIREGAVAYLEKPFIDLQSLATALARAFPELSVKTPKRSGRRL